ncbi:MAG TPA: phosphate ABC transporter ATP-binding protein PstB [Candidatus Aminicenantes bacterium]|nr:phosphate ABC transporter ATP-binding protein PstB [Candidatus Aminicenantes bacterium]HRY65973.1 phosphate ABC transporter ATP-binding protein PstB [Candidatus Aminicenantes bacterium]HRZ72978.1 phosphate ABC transporter ATP-binding protein PstB [Candidatus Aminicenantes bacterium]
MAIIEVRDLDFFYGKFQALKKINLDIERNRITALIGPSGCGKTTFLRTLDRMADLIDGVSVTGRILIDGRDIYAPGTDLLALRKKVGMVFQRPNPFPLSVYDNVVYGLRVHGLRDPRALEARLIRSLEAVHLWDELKSRLDENALRLSGEQQQRLCIARLLAVEPEILLMDEPCSALDLAATAAIEDLMAELKKRYTIVIVTHNMQQAARVSDVTGYFLLGELVEIGETRRVFTAPRDPRTEDYITGRFG